MPQVPRSGFTRSSHRSVRRPTHDYDAAQQALAGGQNAAAQGAKDAVYGDGNLLPGTVSGSKLVDGSIPAQKFASNIVPPEIVTALPTLPDSLYPQGKIVFLTTDQKLYRNTTGAIWSRATDGADILADSITAGQIAAGAIGASEIAANSINADHLVIGGVESGNLVKNGSFERFDPSLDDVYVSVGTGDKSKMYGWLVSAVLLVAALTSANAKTGTKVLGIRANGSQTNTELVQFIPVLAGRRYRLKGWVWKGAAGGQPVYLTAHSADESAAVVSYHVIGGVAMQNATVTPMQVEGYYTVPTDGSVSYLRVAVRLMNTPLLTEVFSAEDVVLELLPEGVQNEPGNVVIDSSGITINNGALALQDEFGKSVLTASGFTGPWGDLISLGLYNARFLQGTAGVVANGRTSALPYWTLSNTSGSPVATLVLNTGLRVTFAALGDEKRLLSDRVPVRPQVAYSVPMQASTVWAAGLLVINTRIYWYKADGTASATPSTLLDSVSYGASVTANAFELTPVYSPADARYAQLDVRVSETVAHNATNELTIVATGLREAPPENLTSLNPDFGDVSVNTISAAGMGTGWTEVPTPAAATVVTAGTYYYGNAESAAFSTPTLGGRYLMLVTGSVFSNTAGIITLRLGVHDAANVLISTISYAREEAAAASEYMSFSIVGAWPVGAGSVSRKLRLYVSHSTSGATVTPWYVNFVVMPLMG